MRLTLAMIAGLVKVEQQSRAGQGRWLVDLAVQGAGAGRGAPVHAIKRIARLIRPHAGNPRRVLEQPVDHAHVANGPARRQIITLQRDNLRINQQIMRLGIDAITAVQAEQVAALHHHRPNLVVAAHITLNLVVRRHLPAGRQHADLQPFSLDAETRRLLIECLLRQHIFQQYPRDRQPARVANGDGNADFFADFRRQVLASPAGGDAFDP